MSLKTQSGNLLETLDLLVSAVHNDGAVNSVTEPSLGIRNQSNLQPVLVMSPVEKVLAGEKHGNQGSTHTKPQKRG